MQLNSESGTLPPVMKGIEARALKVAVTTVVMTASLGCGARGPEEPVPARTVGLPPIPFKDGPVAVDVVYPPDSSLIATRDSNFVFGSVGNGAVELTIDGHPVAVEANGSFLAWLPVPADPDDSLARYDLVAKLGDEVARANHTVRLPPRAIVLPYQTATLDTASVSPRGVWWVRTGELIPVRARAAAGAFVSLRLPGGDEVPLTEARDQQLGPVYFGEFVAHEPIGRGRLSPGLPPLPAELSGATPYCDPRPEYEKQGPVVGDTASTADGPSDSMTMAEGRPVTPDECAVLEVVVGPDTVRSPLPLDLRIIAEPGPAVEFREEPSGAGRDGFVVGRAGPSATTLWQWTEGVRARVTGRRGDAVRVRLDQLTEAWVAVRELSWLRGTSLPARARVGNVRLSSRSDRVEVRIDVDQPVPYEVEIEERELSLTLYSAYGDTDRIRYGPAGDYVRSVRWDQNSSDRYVLRLELAQPAWGYRAKHEAGVLALDIRKPPPIDSLNHLSGLTIAVDAGHPPGGSIGPTRLYEGDANLAIAYRLRRLLEQEGARVIMTRMDRHAVRLYDRTSRADLFDSDIMITIHNNALPDGVKPFENHGTSVYYFHPQSLDLARALQTGLLESLGLKDLGIGRASLALVRPTWMPSVLTEGAFMMIPEQEAALRDPDFLEAYAVGVVEGLRAFLRSRLEATLAQ